MPERCYEDDITFSSQRALLFAIAYRMLGSRQDAEDLLQDTWLRWNAVDIENLNSKTGWLTTVITRLSIDSLRSAKVQRETYIGLWLPEPLVETDDCSPEHISEQNDTVTVALLYVLERLTPEERAAFLLRQVFDIDYKELAGILATSESNCRQLVHRATKHVKQAHKHTDVPNSTHKELIDQFMRAAQRGDHAGLIRLLADDVTLTGDGGGVVPTSAKVLSGTDSVTGIYMYVHSTLRGVVS